MKQSKKTTILLGLAFVFTYSGNLAFNSWTQYNFYVNKANEWGMLVRPKWMPQLEKPVLAETKFYEYSKLAEKQGKTMLMHAFLFFASAYTLGMTSIKLLDKPIKKRERERKQAE